MGTLNVFNANPSLGAVYTIASVTITVKNSEGVPITEPMAVMQVQFGFSAQITPIFDLVSKDMILIRGVPMGEIALAGLIGGTHKIIEFIEAFSKSCDTGGSLEIKTENSCETDKRPITVKFSTAIMKNIAGSVSASSPAFMGSISISCYNMEIEIPDSSSSSSSSS